GGGRVRDEPDAGVGEHEERSARMVAPEMVEVAEIRRSVERGHVVIGIRGWWTGGRVRRDWRTRRAAELVHPGKGCPGPIDAVATLLHPHHHVHVPASVTALEPVAGYGYDRCVPFAPGVVRGGRPLTQHKCG